MCSNASVVRSRRAATRKVPRARAIPKVLNPMSTRSRWHSRRQNTSRKRPRSITKIEAKHSELKHRHGYDVATSSGLLGMEMQGAVTIYAVNLKRILKLTVRELRRKKQQKLKKKASFPWKMGLDAYFLFCCLAGEKNVSSSVASLSCWKVCKSQIAPHLAMGAKIRVLFRKPSYNRPAPHRTMA
jgi:hypothetical protein